MKEIVDKGYCIISGAVLAIVMAFPVAGLMALIFRFPIPLVGYASGISALVPAMVAVLFYGILMGGFVVLGLLGGIVGGIAYRRTAGVKSMFWRAILISCFLIDTLVLFVGAIWPWE